MGLLSKQIFRLDPVLLRADQGARSAENGWCFVLVDPTTRWATDRLRQST
jgi:hypothetical protein